MAAKRGETEAHRDLKHRATVWALANGFSACATEVRLPRSRYRADVAACVVTGHGGIPGETVVFECKQARADLLRDSADEKRTMKRLEKITTRRRELERMLGLHLPDLRRGESLFAEYDSYDLDSIRHDGLRTVRREEAQLRTKIFGATKFSKLMRYKCAERHYLVVSEGILRGHEAPDGWGVLEARGEGLELVQFPRRIEVGEGVRVALLQAIALASTRRLNAAAGIEWEAIEAARRKAVP